MLIVPDVAAWCQLSEIGKPAAESQVASLIIMSMMGAMGQRAASVAEAKRSLSELLSRVVYRGESILIAKRGKPVARLVPVTSSRRESLAGVRGWLNDNDPFFAAIEGIVGNRHARRPRTAGRGRPAIGSFRNR